MKILIIHILRLGDALQLTPVIKGLKETFKDASISIVTSSLGAQIFSKQKEVDQIFQVSIDELVSLIKSSRIEDVHSAVDILTNEFEPILSEKWDWVVNFNYTFASALLAYLFQGKHYSGFYASPKRQFFAKEKWFAYSLAAFANRKYSTFNWVDINKNIIKLPYTPQKSFYPIEKEAITDAEEHLKKIGFNGQNIIGISPGASDDYKRWPIEKFTALTKNLIEKHEYKILLIGDEKEKELGLQIKNGVSGNCEDLTGKTTLPQLAAYLSKCNLFISNDSGPMHLANAVGTKTISFFFNTHFIETGPYGTGNIAIFPDIPCFPCQSTANCPRRECLSYINPGLAERIVTSYDKLINGEQSFSISEADGPVAINRSLFDPWGNLDWAPIDGRPLKIDDIIRLTYKLFWLNSLRFNDYGNDDQTHYMKDILSLYDPFEKNQEAETLLQKLRDTGNKAKNLYNESHLLSMKIYEALLNSDTGEVSKIGEELQKLEDKISEHGEDPYINAFIEFNKLRLDNLEEPQMLTLAIKTANFYNDVQATSDRWVNTAEYVINHINKQ